MHPCTTGIPCIVELSILVKRAFLYVYAFVETTTIRVFLTPFDVRQVSYTYSHRSMLHPFS